MRYVSRYLYSLTHDNSLVEELTQETFFQAIQSLDRYNGECKLRVWLCQIAKHLWYKELSRRKKYEQIYIDDIGQTIVAQTNIEQEVIEREENAFYNDCISKMAMEDQQIIYLRNVCEFSYREIGDMFCKSEVWARVKYYRIKEKIVALWKEKEE